MTEVLRGESSREQWFLKRKNYETGWLYSLHGCWLTAGDWYAYCSVLWLFCVSCFVVYVNLYALVDNNHFFFTKHKFALETVQGHDIFWRRVTGSPNPWHCWERSSSTIPSRRNGLSTLRGSSSSSKLTISLETLRRISGGLLSFRSSDQRPTNC